MVKVKTCFVISAISRSSFFFTLEHSKPREAISRPMFFLAGRPGTTGRMDERFSEVGGFGPQLDKSEQHPQKLCGMLSKICAEIPGTAIFELDQYQNFRPEAFDL